MILTQQHASKEGCSLLLGLPTIPQEPPFNRNIPGESFSADLTLAPTVHQGWQCWPMPAWVPGTCSVTLMFWRCPEPSIGLPHRWVSCPTLSRFCRWAVPSGRSRDVGVPSHCHTLVHGPSGRSRDDGADAISCAFQILSLVSPLTSDAPALGPPPGMRGHPKVGKSGPH